ncbi:MAG: leader peptidase (prepilin peptidase) / N-methyltransferase [Gemmatimonadaceae bacterium]|jgi:leader peptidase (prepilin peptidase)/N-methyltransferase|nr:leader peptidase (prepilin peptidase) / N-methyltransferase [Gemmatimonadaceae bacterium]
MIDILEGIYVFAVGACMGSFLNVCIGRWPEGLSVVKPRSRCPKCGHQIKATENIPIVSWLMLRGRCSGCGERISIQYPIVELLVGLLWLAAFLQFGLSFAAFRIAVLATVLLGISITDAKHFIIPDGFTVFGLFFVLLTSLVALYLGESYPFAGPWDAVIGMCVGAGAISIVGWLGEVWLKRPAMGFGDVTLMAVVGAAVGPTRALLTIFIGAVLAPIVLLGVVYPLSARGLAEDAGQTELALEAGASWRKRELPFGVFLAPAALIALLWGDTIIAWYLRISGL